MDGPSSSLWWLSTPYRAAASGRFRIRTIPLGVSGSGRRLVRASGSTWSLLATRERVGLICEETGPCVIDIARVGRVAELFDASEEVLLRTA